MVDKIQSEKIQGLVLSLIFNRARIHPEPRKRSLNIIQLNSPFFLRYYVYTTAATSGKQLFRERLWEKMCTRESRKIIWDMINTLFLIL